MGWRRNLRRGCVGLLWGSGSVCSASELSFAQPSPTSHSWSWFGDRRSWISQVPFKPKAEGHQRPAERQTRTKQAWYRSHGTFLFFRSSRPRAGAYFCCPPTHPERNKDILLIVDTCWCQVVIWCTYFLHNICNDFCIITICLLHRNLHRSQLFSLTNYDHLEESPGKLFPPTRRLSLLRVRAELRSAQPNLSLVVVLVR